MTLSTTLAIYLGFLLESLWLWEAASEKFEHPELNPIKAPGASTRITIIGIALVSGLFLIGISELVGENPVTAAIENFLEYILMGITMFYILVAGAVGGWLVPRVNEYHIVSVLAIVALNTLTQGNITNLFLISILIGIPLILSIALALQRYSPTPAGKVILYLLYLGAVILLTIQSGIMDVFQKTQLTIFEAIIFGSTLCFLALHTLLGIRFFVITTSLVLPMNRRFVQPMMSKLFKDDQIAPSPFFLTLAIILAAVILNQKFAFLPANAFAVVLVILSTQLLFRPNNHLEIG